MILKNFFYGTKQVLKIMLDGKLIWNFEEQTNLMANVVFCTTVKGTLHGLTMLLVTGEAESTSDAKGYVRSIPVFNLYGDGEAWSDGLGLLRPVPVFNLYGECIGYSLAEGFARALPVVHMESDVPHDFDTYGEAHANQAIPMSSEAEKLYFTEAGTARAVFLLPIEGSARSMIQIGEAYLQTLILKPMEGIARSTSDGVAYIRPTDVMRLYGQTESGNMAEATIDLVPPLPIGGTTTSNNNTVGTVVTPSAESVKGKSRNNSYHQADLELWYLPSQENDTLYVRQTYSATVNNGILEVI